MIPIVKKRAEDLQMKKLARGKQRMWALASFCKLKDLSGVTHHAHVQW